MNKHHPVSENSGEPFQLEPLWNLSPNFRCPVIGACLTLSEQAAILKKSGFDTRLMTDYQIHQSLMERLDCENPVSRRADRFIRHKHKKSIGLFHAMTPNQLDQAWSMACSHGENDGLFFVICSRPDVGSALKVRVFGDLHMLCHTNMTDVLRARRHVDDHIHTSRRLARLLDQEKKKSKDFRSQIKQLRQSLNDETQRRTDVRQHDRPRDETETLKKTVQQLVASCDQLKVTRALADERQRHMERQKRKLEIKLFEMESENRVLREEIRHLICPRSDKASGVEACQPGCKECEHCPKRILMVGGITKLEPFYRDLVEANGNEFIYHDGYMKNSSRQISDMVAHADLVLCPVNCNSHNACQRIKRLCKKYSTHCKMLPGSSLTMISRALTDQIPVDLAGPN